MAAQQEQNSVVTVGVVLPLPVSVSVRSLLDVQAEAARNGAVMGVDDAARSASRHEPRLLIANAPSPLAARSAAERLIAVDGVVALIGGIGNGQASVLSEVAEEHGVLFINIGDQSDALRDSCGTMTFHIEASRTIYLSAMAVELANAGSSHIAVVHQNSSEALLEAQFFAESLEDIGIAVSTYPIAESAIVFQPLLEDIVNDSADAVVLLLPPAQQDAILLQADWIDYDFGFRLYPESESQSRYALAAERMSSSLVASPRIALWDTNLPDQAPGKDFNDRFMSRFAAPADPSAWAAYQGVRLVFDAIEDTSAIDAPALARHILESWSGDVGKPSSAQFRVGDHQLVQDMYVIKVDPNAKWTTQVSSQAALATVVSVLDAASISDLNGAGLDQCVPTIQ